MPAIWVLVLRLLAAGFAGYTAADLVDHFTKGRELRTGQPEPTPSFDNYKFQQRILKSVRFWLVIAFIAALSFFFIRDKLKQK